MMRLLVPLVLLVLGLGGGIGAGLALSPSEAKETGEIADPCGDATPPDYGAAEAAPAPRRGAEHSSRDYIRLNNQFVVPLLTEGEVDSLVMLSLSVEVRAGQEEQVLLMEPKLRDIFLQVLFDHANTGGFDGLYTAQSAMRELRNSLLSAAQDELGPLVTDVLILELVRKAQ
jgi:hypothetical protein